MSACGVDYRAFEPEPGAATSRIACVGKSRIRASRALSAKIPWTQRRTGWPTRIPEVGAIEVPTDRKLAGVAKNLKVHGGFFAANIRPMNESEKRREQRIPVAGLPVTGEMFVLHGTDRLQVRGIQDFSDAGISLYLDEPIGERQGVTIEFADRGIRLEVFGAVTWCREQASSAVVGDNPGRCLLGIELLASSILAAVMRKTVGQPTPA